MGRSALKQRVKIMNDKLIKRRLELMIKDIKDYVPDYGFQIENIITERFEDILNENNKTEYNINC